MDITATSRVSDVATERPATIKVFQRYAIDFCCGGKRPISEVCGERGIDLEPLLADLHQAAAGPDDERDWQKASLSQIVDHIQLRFHRPLREELPRLAGMMDKVVRRHGADRPETLELQATLTAFQEDILQHTGKEDAVLFPAIVALGNGQGGAGSWISRPIAMMEVEHEDAGRALARMRELSGGYVPPQGACPTFRGLYYGLSELERDMHLHVHLENHILFPRAIAAALATMPAPAPAR